MHAYWWGFWILIWVVYFSFFSSMRRVTYRKLQSPLQVLQQRYAAGQISSVEYEERHAKLIRDTAA
jgi:putative membrane protein